MAASAICTIYSHMAQAQSIVSQRQGQGYAFSWCVCGGCLPSFLPMLSSLVAAVGFSIVAVSICLVCKCCIEQTKIQFFAVVFLLSGADVCWTVCLARSVSALH